MLSPIEPALAQISASGQSATSTYIGAIGELFSVTGEAATVALVGGDRPHTGGWPDIAPRGLTPALQREVDAYLTEL